MDALVVFSLLTSAFDDGLGAWYSSKKDFKASADMKMSDVIKEFPRPVLSCLAINWIMATANQGFHNPMKSFSFRELFGQGHRDWRQHDPGKEHGELEEAHRTVQPAPREAAGRV